MTPKMDPPLQPEAPAAPRVTDEMVPPLRDEKPDNQVLTDLRVAVQEFKEGTHRQPGIRATLGGRAYDLLVIRAGSAAEARRQLGVEILERSDALGRTEIRLDEIGGAK